MHVYDGLFDLKSFIGLWLRHLCFLFLATNDFIALLYLWCLFMAVKIGSVLSVKMRRAQDRMAALDKRLQKKKASLEALERGSAVASTVPAMDGMDK